MFQKATHLLRLLGDWGYQAYFVGGCVRDLLLGHTPQDIDITTSAPPGEIMRIFESYRTIPTGLSHGTVTVMVDQTPFEITTFRKEGTYSDGRHPDNVTFAKTVEEDLARRDFTINAMAYHPASGIVDPFGGAQDLQHRRIRCVGDPRRRFTEDSLRILRGLRFSSSLGFSVEAKTAKAMEELAHLCRDLSSERIVSELSQFLCGGGVTDVMLRHQRTLCKIFPILSPLACYDQHNPHHCYDLYTHTAFAVGCSVPVLPVRLALLLHDTGKPVCAFTDGDGIGHFYGHGKESCRLAEQFFEEYPSFGAKVRSEVLTLILYHDLQLGQTPASVRRWSHRLTPETLGRLMDVKEGDLTAMAPHPQRLSILKDQRRMLAEMVEKDSCFSLRQLQVNGHDMIAIGCRGPEIGRMLDLLLLKVIDETLPNEHTALIAFAQAAFEETHS